MGVAATLIISVVSGCLCRSSEPLTRIDGIGHMSSADLAVTFRKRHYSGMTTTPVLSFDIHWRPWTQSLNSS